MRRQSVEQNQQKRDVFQQYAPKSISQMKAIQNIQLIFNLLRNAQHHLTV